MNWKEFLKPDWRKIVLIVILIFWFIIGFFSFSILQGASVNPILENILLSGLLFFIPIPYLVFEVLNVHSWSVFLSGSLVIILGLAYLYLIPCLIIWIYDKLKKK